MSDHFDTLRRWVQPAGPKEGRDPVRASRAYVAMRSRIFAVSPSDLGLAPTERLPRVWAVLVDLPVGRGVATVLCVADGSTSLYTGDGGAIIGAGTVPAVMDAAAWLLDTAERVLDGVSPGTSIGLPAPGSVAFLVLAHDGMRRVEVAESEAMMASGGAAPELYRATRDVAAQLRRADAADGPRSGTPDG